MQQPDSGNRKIMSPIDGVMRRQEHEEILNRMAAAVFATGGGAAFLDYLKTLTVQRVCGPAVASRELRHLEGQRWLVSVIQARLNEGRKGPRSFEHDVPEDQPGLGH